VEEGEVRGVAKKWVAEVLRKPARGATSCGAGEGVKSIHEDGDGEVREGNGVIIGQPVRHRPRLVRVALTEL
jgi:hypothetical protein